MKRMFTFALALSAVSFVPGLARAELKIGTVDLQRALEETDEGKKAKAKLKAEFEKKQKELDQRQEDLKKDKAEIDRQGAILKPEALQQKQQALQQKLVQLQETYMRLQKDLQEKEATETQRIFRKMTAIISTIAQNEGFTFVMERNSGVLYAPPSLDLTNELIRKYNAAPALDASPAGGPSKTR
jgi:outer membrane protein